jgi:transposase
MAMGKRRPRPKQTSMWVATQDLPRSAAHPFYTRLNQILDKADFDGYVESLRQRVYADEVGRPGLPPGRYFRMLLLGYFEGLDSERAIAWRAADSLSVRSFLRLELHETPPDHSTVSRTRRLIDVETQWVPTGESLVHHLQVLDCRRMNPRTQTRLPTSVRSSADPATHRSRFSSFRSLPGRACAATEHAIGNLEQIRAR